MRDEWDEIKELKKKIDDLEWQVEHIEENRRTSSLLHSAGIIALAIACICNSIKLIILMH
jgi:tetrahydromethanopterin S-methyltransferase subunit F